MESYYGNLLLYQCNCTKVLRVFIKTSFILQESADIERTKWYNTLLLYALNTKETEESLKTDPDVRLVPFAVEKIVVPRLTCKITFF